MDLKIDNYFLLLLSNRKLLPISHMTFDLVSSLVYFGSSLFFEHWLYRNGFISISRFPLSGHSVVVWIRKKMTAVFEWNQQFKPRKKVQTRNESIFVITNYVPFYVNSISTINSAKILENCSDLSPSITVRFSG